MANLKVHVGTSGITSVAAVSDDLPLVTDCPTFTFKRELCAYLVSTLLP